MNINAVLKSALVKIGMEGVEWMAGEKFLYMVQVCTVCSTANQGQDLAPHPLSSTVA